MARPRKELQEQQARTAQIFASDSVWSDRPTPVVPVPSCLTCAYRLHNGSYNECHRYPPPFAVIAKDGSDWCGEFRVKP